MNPPSCNEKKRKKKKEKKNPPIIHSSGFSFVSKSVCPSPNKKLPPRRDTTVEATTLLLYCIRYLLPVPFSREKVATGCFPTRAPRKHKPVKKQQNPTRVLWWYVV